MHKGPRIFVLDLRREGTNYAPGVSLLDETELRRREAFRKEEDRWRYTAAHVGLRMVLSACLGVPANTLAFGRHPCPRCGAAHGKPYLRGSHELDWSMAHAGDVVLYGVAAQPVGIDIEATIDGAEVQLLRSALHPLEARELESLPEESRATAFTQCWTRKEALLKGCGIGLALPPADCFVGLGSRYVQGRRRADGWWLQDLGVTGGYFASLALHGRRPSLNLIINSLNTVSSLSNE